MNNKLLKCLTAGAMVAALALASPVLARGGGAVAAMVAAVAVMVVAACMGSMEVECISVAWAAACVPAAWVSQAAAVGFGGSRVGFAGSRFAGPRFAHAGFAHHGRFFHHRHHRFAFIGVGVPYAYAAYDSCWRRTWTPYGLRWVNVCGDYGYY